MGSHSVTCHPTQVDTLRHNPSQPGQYSIYQPRKMEGWVDLGSLIAVRLGIEPASTGSQVQRPNRYQVTQTSACMFDLLKVYGKKIKYCRLIADSPKLKVLTCFRPLLFVCASSRGIGSREVRHFVWHVVAWRHHIHPVSSYFWWHFVRTFLYCVYIRLGALLFLCFLVSISVKIDSR